MNGSLGLPGLSIIMKSDGNFWKWSREEVSLDVEVEMQVGMLGTMGTETEHVEDRKMHSRLVNLRAPFGLCF